MRIAPLLVFSVSIAFVACSPAVRPCNAINCALGCCDPSGVCQAPSSLTCGTAGSACSACLLGQQCQFGNCQGAGGGSGGSSSGGGGQVPMTFEAQYQSLFNEVCAFSTRCGMYSDVGACLRREAVIPSFSTTLKVKVNVMRADACRASLRSASCSAAIGGLDGQPWPYLLTAECAPALGDLFVPGSSERLPFQQLLDGLVPAGGACRHSLECLPNGWCDTSSSCPGLCQPRLGAVAADSEEKCLPGYFWAIGNGPYQCEKIPGPGEPCVFSCQGVPCTAPCVAGYMCGEQQTCVPWPSTPIGTACSRNAECKAPLICRGGACAARGLVDQLCTPNDCALDLTCASTNLCAADLRPGEACNVTNRYCDEGLVCQASDGGMASCTSSSPGPTGSACGLGCLSMDYCNGSVCARRKQVGMSCSRLEECAQGLTCTGGRCSGCAAEW